MYLGLAVYKCTGPACVKVGKPLRTRLSFTIRYLTFRSGQLCFSAGWKFALNPLFFLLVSILYAAVQKEICSSLKNVFTAVSSVVHALFPHCLLKDKQCVNISSPPDLLLVSVQYWWEEKVLGPSPAKPCLFFLPQEKPSSSVCGSGPVSVVDFLLCRWVVQLCFPRVLLNNTTTCTEWKLALTLTNVLHLLLSHTLCVGVLSGASSFLGTHWQGSGSCSNLQARCDHMHCPTYPGPALPPDPGWICRLLLETTLGLHHGQFLFSLPSVCDVGLQKTHIDVLCFCLVEFIL